ncbi:protein-L-isoaspartate O-methyltransferase [Chitinibacter bivalviorum]|uniref:Protein-L-isoaspartate O-methyltransferase n=1 Tax=Chitinibacter bivalviorum TaxID=2739434 RepID=A0A7H9BEL8_9NEIS|nr:protein-L-isoaspartate O-methyltransferase [Chitinibacter bivalviorum]QLG86997.1 protein-L-isoaspartate O-methyltransferase [Chitinibacter bivalviorum]
MDWEKARYLLVEQQIRPWNVLDSNVLDRILNTRREDFVPADKKELAFVDVELPLGNGQLMLAPKVEARFLQEIALKASDKLLIVGSGTAYLAALAAGLCAQVVVIEADTKQAELTNAALKAAGIKNVSIEVGATLASKQGPFNAIIAAASFEAIPEELSKQLVVGGRLITVIGQEPIMHATVVTTQGSGANTTREVFDYNLPRFQAAAKPFAF